MSIEGCSVYLNDDIMEYISKHQRRPFKKYKRTHITYYNSDFPTRGKESCKTLRKVMESLYNNQLLSFVNEKNWKDTAFILKTLSLNHDLHDVNYAYLGQSCNIRKHRISVLKKAGLRALDALTLASSEECDPFDDFSAIDFKDAYTSKELREAGFSAFDLQSAGFAARDLSYAGFSDHIIKDAGYSVRQLKDAYFSVERLILLDVSLEELRIAGFELWELISHFSGKDLALSGFTASQLERYFNPKALADQGITLAQIKALGYSANSFKRSGFSAWQLKEVGFNASDPVHGGFTFDQLVDLGFSAQELKNAGFYPKQLLEAGFSWPEIEELMQ
ncbi:MAG: hypothetical protein HRU09_20860 [Oligoflexales bacterium]|nr:hypothetical protein [Oligoflexales bacterium]